MIPVIIPSISPVSTILIEEIVAAGGNPIQIHSKSSAAINRNAGLAAVSNAEMVVMIDDDIKPMHRDWLKIMIGALSRPEVVMVSAQLYAANGERFGYMTGLQDWGGIPKDTGETVVPTKRLLTACCAFKPSGCKFDEGYVGSGFEDIDFCNQLAAARPDGIFLVCHDAHVIHFNEMREQRGINWVMNKARYEMKWGTIK